MLARFRDGAASGPGRDRRRYEPEIRTAASRHRRSRCLHRPHRGDARLEVLPHAPTGEHDSAKSASGANQIEHCRELRIVKEVVSLDVV